MGRHYTAGMQFTQNPRRAFTQWAPMAKLALLALWTSALLTVPAHAQWKWRDKSGQVNVSDRPPPLEVPDKDILVKPSPDARRTAGLAPAVPAAPATPASATPLDRELEARKRAAEQEQAAKAKAEEEKLAAQRGENCRRARSHLAALESGRRMARINDKGEREVLDERAIADEARQAREVITSDCR